ncbi:hypothetical protein [Leptospira noguchii]|uniref:hypothetical protein n=1 Tax=Leptospira noguchii TaxID=28182 RepID=UPI00077344AB|nr:hypothetical protein [Leptospira noguchii]
MGKVAEAIADIGIILLMVSGVGFAFAAFGETTAVKIALVGAILSLSGGTSKDAINSNGTLNIKDFLYTCGIEGTSGVNSRSNWDGSISVGHKGCYPTPIGE